MSDARNSKAPAFMFYTKDFLSDEKVAVMSNQELGCYIRLLCYAWQEGSIPADVARLSRLCAEPIDVMQDVWSHVSTCFVTHPSAPNRLIQPRMEQEREKQKARHDERQRAGKASAESRKNKTLPGKLESVSSGASDLLEQNGNLSIAVAISSADSKCVPDGTHVVGLADGLPTTCAVIQQSLLPEDGHQPSTLQGEIVSGSRVPNCPQQQVIELYHKLMPTNPKVVIWGKDREALLRSRWKEMAVTTNETLGGGYQNSAAGLEWWENFMAYCAKSKFLTGQVEPGPNKTPFVASMEWLVRPKNFAKILEGMYHRD